MNKRLTVEEQVVATEMFGRVLPDLVRLHSSVELKKAVTETVAAIKTGLIALREESGSKQ